MSENLPATISKCYLPELVADPTAMGEVFADEMEGLSFRFERVKIPSGGAVFFEVPGDGDEPEMAKELLGVILDDHATNAYWHNKYDGANTPPDCASTDGIKGIVKETGEIVECKTCPFNQFGSAGGKSKACKNMRRIYLLQEGNVFPLLLTVPPTGLGNFSDYKGQKIVGKGRRSTSVITRVALIKDKSGDGITYSKPVFSVAQVLDPENAKLLGMYSQKIKEFTRSIGVMADDYNTEGQAPAEQVF